MHPAHVGCLAAGCIDACSPANNHVLDWGAPGLDDTLATLHAAGVLTADAGADLPQAQAPAVLALPGGTLLLLFALATPTSGVPPDWAAQAQRHCPAAAPGRGGGPRLGRSPAAASACRRRRRGLAALGRELDPQGRWRIRWQ